METMTRKNGKIFTFKSDKNRFFFPEEYVKMRTQLRPNARHYIELLLHTGARINEMRNVKIEDINIEDKWIILRVTKTKAKKGEKKGTPRYIPISTKFKDYLRRYIKKHKLSMDDTLGVPSTPAVAMMLKRAAKKANLKNPNDFSAHTLRKTLETWLMALGVGDMKLIKHFGHDFKTAASHYVQPDIFNPTQRVMMRDIVGDLYER